MLSNYVRIALRQLRKHKFYTGINLFGLALGMACSLLIGLWVNDELSYDHFLPDARNIYFVRFNSTFNGEVTTSYTTPGPLQEAMAKDIPQLAAVTKLNWRGETLMKADQKTIKHFGGYATADFFTVFALPALYGNPSAALAKPDRIIITRHVADALFPQGLALGKTIQLNNEKVYTVGAVIENLPANSTLQFDWLVNWKQVEEPWMKTWGNSSFLTYARLKANTTPSQAEAAMKGTYARYTDWPNAKATYPILQPLTDLHLYSEYRHGQVVGGRIEYVRIFSLVAAFILLIACINFMNLATAHSAIRAKEVGVRKVMGARRLSLMGQFLSESMLMSLVAVVLAVLLVWLVLPAFNAEFDKQLSLDLTRPVLWLLLTGIVLATGLLAGSYPALFLSGLQPVRILKGIFQFGNGPATFRRILVVVQFSLSIFLLVGMLTVGRQMHYLRTKNLGLDRQDVIYLPMEGEIARPERLEPFRQQIMRLPAVASATTTMFLPVDVQGSSGDLTWPGKDPNQQTNVSCMFVGGDFIRTMNIQLLDGRDFLTTSNADSSNYIINEATAQLMGIKDPVGKEISFWMGKGRVIGLTKNFHIQSLHQAITPLVLVYQPANTSYLLVRTRPGQTTPAIAALKRLSKQFNPNYPFDYHFVDQAYEKLYQSEQQVNTLINGFGVLAILISCLGLIALAAFTAEQRQKEIGIRKVLGASVTTIVSMLSKDFLRLVFIALVLVSPLAWWSLSQWLGTFAYHTDLSWWLFGLAGLLAMTIALLTVSFQSIKAALMNPVKSLRSD